MNLSTLLFGCDMTLYLPQEYLEARGVSHEQMTIKKSVCMDTFWQMHEGGVLQQEVIHLPPPKSDLAQLISRYKKNYPDRGVFKKMQTLDAHGYMAFNDQKAFSKAYFVPCLQRIADTARRQSKALLEKDILRNIQDETGRKQAIAWKEGEDEHPLCPVGGVIADYYLQYNKEGHYLWRKYSYYGKKKLYMQRLRTHKQKKYTYINPYLPYDVCNTGTILHIASTQGALHTESWLEVLGRVLFLEHTIPLEYAQSLKWGLRLFPTMSPKVQMYEADHITHDALFHAKRLDESIEAAQFCEAEYEQIQKGMLRMYLARAMFYEGFTEQIAMMNMKV